MMNKEQTVEKIMEEYERYGLSRPLAQLIYDLAITMDVPQESIYPGMRMNFNNAFGINDVRAAKDAGAALFDYVITEMKAENPSATDKEIADSIESIGIDVLTNSLPEKVFASSDEVKKSVIDEMQKYVEEQKTSKFITKDYKSMTQEELEKELAEIVKKNYEKGIVLLDRDYDICKLRLKKLSDVENIEGIDTIIAIIHAMKYKPDLKPYCKGMNDKTPLIHPITGEYAWKEQNYDDFVSREEFINRTGIFVTPQYFSCIIYGSEWKEAKGSGKSLDDFIDNYENGEFDGGVAEVPLHGTFKYIISDDYLSCLGDYEDMYEPNIWEIINCLARSMAHEYESKWETIEKYKSVLGDAMQVLEKYQMLYAEPTSKMTS